MADARWPGWLEWLLTHSIDGRGNAPKCLEQPGTPGVIKVYVEMCPLPQARRRTAKALGYVSSDEATSGIWPTSSPDHPHFDQLASVDLDSAACPTTT